LIVALEAALRILAERDRDSAPLGRNQANWDNESRAWTEITLESLDRAVNSLSGAAAIAIEISDQAARSLILKWTDDIKRARELLASKMPFSNQRSFSKQKNVMKEIKSYLAK
jgi:hypothetical protein